MSQQTNFGYQKVSWTEKTAKVTEVFNSVAHKYDLMNDLMSFGIHRLWKRQTLYHCALESGQQIVDLAGGTGDLAKLMAPVIGPEGLIILADLNYAMLTIGKHKLINAGILAPVYYLQTNAEALSLPSNYFDCVTMAFGLRNVTNKELALQEILRILKPNGRIIILEFSHIENIFLKQLYDLYSFMILPKLGSLIVGDQSSYQYLVESIRMQPTQAELVTILEHSGFENCSYTNLTQGICAIHKGFK